MERSNRAALGSAAAEVGKEAEITPSHKRIRGGIIRGESGEKTDKKTAEINAEKGSEIRPEKGSEKGVKSRGISASKFGRKSRQIKAQKQVYFHGKIRVIFEGDFMAKQGRLLTVFYGGFLLPDQG